MQSYYEINVSLQGEHLFATAPRSCATKEEMEAVRLQIRLRFPPYQGFDISVTYWEAKGRQVV